MTTRNFRVNNGLEVGDIVISASANTIVGLATAAPSADGDVANKKYVDDKANITVLNTSVAVADTGSNGTITNTADGGAVLSQTAATTTVTASGAINLTATTDVVVPANVGITFGTGEKIEGDSTDLTVASGAKINLTATSDVHIPNDVGIAFGAGGEKIESDGTDLTATVTGNFIVSGTTAMVAPKGTTGQRPSVSTGLIRFNSTLGVYEGSTDGSTYTSFLTAPSGEAADINKDVFTTSNASTTEFALSFTPAEAQNVIVFVDNIFQESTSNYTVSGSTLTMTAALHDGARLVALHGFDGSGGVSGATWIGGSNTDVDSAVENVDTFTTSTYRSAEYTYVATNAGSDNDSTVGHQTGKSRAQRRNRLHPQNKSLYQGATQQGTGTRGEHYHRQVDRYQQGRSRKSKLQVQAGRQGAQSPQKGGSVRSHAPTRGSQTHTVDAYQL